MGYYIDFYFDPGTISSYKNVIEKLRRAGAVRLPADKTHPKWRNFIDMVYARNGVKIIKGHKKGILFFEKTDENDSLINFTIYTNPSSNSYVNNEIWTDAGNKVWSDGRFSWGSDQHYLVKQLETYCDLAEKVGFRVYDGQLNIWLTRETLNSIVEGFSRSARSIVELFGTVDEQKYKEAANKVLQSKSLQEKDYSAG